MRTIKFRQKTKEGWHYWGYIGGGFISPLIGAEDSDKPSDQFTGLTDKTGKEIYEGDVLGGLNTNKRKIIATVVWNETLAGFKLENEYSLTWKGWGVIGNIYENPELLETKLTSVLTRTLPQPPRCPRTHETGRSGYCLLPSTLSLIGGKIKLKNMKIWLIKHKGKSWIGNFLGLGSEFTVKPITGKEQKFYAGNAFYRKKDAELYLKTFSHPEFLEVVWAEVQQVKTDNRKC